MLSNTERPSSTTKVSEIGLIIIHLLGTRVVRGRRSRCGSVTSGSDSPPDCHSIPSVSLRYFAKAEETAKAKFERLKKLVEFYNV